MSTIKNKNNKKINFCVYFLNLVHVSKSGAKLLLFAHMQNSNSRAKDSKNNDFYYLRPSNGLFL